MMKHLFMKKKPCSILLLLKDDLQQWYPSKLARVSGASYVHTTNLLSALKAFNVVASERKGKQNIFKLTEKGAYLALSLDDFSKKCDACEQETKKPAEIPPPAQVPLPKKPVPLQEKR
ncbi:MAG: hypothetical protein NT051_00065 [Candidatus Micrarchaeota archaeon]|nr:hypothetical protein [Candidatus Micrarchaeota archaeon]